MRGPRSAFLVAATMAILLACGAGDRSPRGPFPTMAAGGAFADSARAVAFAEDHLGSSTMGSTQVTCEPWSRLNTPAWLPRPAGPLPESWPDWPEPSPGVERIYAPDSLSIAVLSRAI